MSRDSYNVLAKKSYLDLMPRVPSPAAAVGAQRIIFVEQERQQKKKMPTTFCFRYQVFWRCTPGIGTKHLEVQQWTLARIVFEVRRYRDETSTTVDSCLVCFRSWKILGRNTLGSRLFATGSFSKLEEMVWGRNARKVDFC